MASGTSAYPPPLEDGRPSGASARPSDFDRKWFSAPPAYSVPPPRSLPPPPPPIGDARWSVVCGALSGAIGGFLMLLSAQAVLHAQRDPRDLVRGLSVYADRLGAGFADPRVMGLASAAVLGSVAGMVLGLMSRRLLRVGPRLVFFVLLSPILWIFVHAVVIGRFGGPLLHALPVGPLLVGSVVYGACLAVVSPARRA